MADAGDVAVAGSGEHGGHREGSGLSYVVVYVALLALTGTTYALARVDMGWANLPVALLIAFGKASLVIVFFMHLLHETGVSRLVLLIALVFLASLAVLALADGVTRFPLAVSRENGAGIRVAPAE